jgi:glucosylceramidase
VFLLANVAVTLLTQTQTAAADPSTAQVYLTLPDRSKLVEQQTPVAINNNVAPLPDELSVRVDPTKTFQTMDGVGASMTESSAYLFSTKLTPGQRSLVYAALFNKDVGAGIDIVRVPWGVTDMSLADYTYNDRTPAQGEDIPQNDFSISHDQQYIIPRLQEATSANSNLKLVFAPWTAPGWMKDPFFPGQPLSFGFLKPHLYGSYATYLKKAVNGYTVNWLWPYAFSMQNEPLTGTTNYSMFISTPDQAKLIRENVGPTVQNETMAKPKLLAHDEDWADVASARDVTSDAGANPYIKGAAFHCYHGENTRQLLYQKAHPTKEIHNTECTGFGPGDPTWAGDFRWGLRNYIINPTRNYSKSSIYWNLALDENSGPHRTVGCQDCRGIMTVTNAGGVAFNAEYYILAHYGKVVRPGAQRIDSTTFGEGALDTVAFKNPDGSKALIALNSGSAARDFIVREGNAAFRYNLPAGAAASFVWNTPDNTTRDVDNGRLEAESYTISNPANLQPLNITDEGKADQAIQLANDEYIKFANVPFAGTPLSFQMRYATLFSGNIEFHLDSATGPLLATIPFSPNNYTSSAVVAGSVTPSAGSHHLYVVAKGSGTNKLVNLNWVKFAENGHHPDPVVGKANWKAYGVYGGGADVPANVLDGNNDTRWTTGAPMTYGHWFVLDMRKQVTLSSIGAYSKPGDRPTKVKVEVSDNGLDYTTVQAGYTPPADLYQIPLATTMGRYYRITELNENPAVGSWWSINEVNGYYP